MKKNNAIQGLVGEFYKKIFKNFSEPIYVWQGVKNDLILVDYNKAAYDITEGKVKNVIGIKASELHKNEQEIFNDLIKCLKEKTIINKEIVYDFQALKKRRFLGVNYNFLPPNVIFVHTYDITKQKQAEKSLKESEKKYRNLFEEAPNAYFSIRADGTIKNCNQAAIELLGYTKEELLKMNLFDLYTNKPYGLEKARELFKHFLKGGAIQDKELQMKNKEDLPIWVSLTVKPVKNKKGEVIESRSMVININDRKEAEKDLYDKQNFLESIIKASPIGIGVVNNRMFIKVNDYFCNLVGYTRDELLGQNARMVYPSDKDYEYVGKEKYKQLKKYGIGTVETRFKRKNGEILDILLSSTLIDPKNPSMGVTFTVLDITERKKNEQELRRSETKYREAFNRAEFYKDLFAHDINNILQNIRFACDLFEFYKSEPKKLKKITELFEIINNQIIRGSKLVSNIRKLSSIEEPHLSTEQIEIYNVLKKTLEKIGKIPQNKEFKVQFDSIEKKVLIQVDEYIMDVFEILISNALKYNNNQIVEIIIKISEKQKDKINYIQLEFIDNGMGIEDSRKELIFQRAYSRKSIGSGIDLGLSLVKKIIESYKGDIWVEDKIKGDYTQGSKFIILIPQMNSVDI